MVGFIIIIDMFLLLKAPDCVPHHIYIYDEEEEGIIVC